jgi:hypothetical protein
MTDVVSRQAVIDAIDTIYRECPAETIQRTLFANAIAAINALPSLESVDALVKAARGITNQYIGLVDSGDAGDWNPRDEPVVQASLAALSAFDSK